ADENSLMRRHSISTMPSLPEMSVEEQEQADGTSVPGAASADLAASVAALRAGAWLAARVAFQAARRHDAENPEALAGSGLASWWRSEERRVGKEGRAGWSAGYARKVGQG